LSVGGCRFDEIEIDKIDDLYFKLTGASSSLRQISVFAAHNKQTVQVSIDKESP
jgi:hypothetical protein